MEANTPTSITPAADAPVESEATHYERFDNLMMHIERENFPVMLRRRFLEMAMITLWRLGPGPQEGSTDSVWNQIKDRFFSGQEPPVWNERFVRVFRRYFLELARLQT
ncbi:hypothetical protein BKA80DRAFT_312538 [Phyllosticta citrichinensis]